MFREYRLIVWSSFRVTAALFFAGGLLLELRRWDHLFRVSLPAWLRIPGAVLMCGGGSLVLLCGVRLADCGILEQRGDRLLPRSLATSGPFQYSRNPMSLGAVALAAGLGLSYLSPLILLFTALLFFIFHLVVVYVEEPRLANRFGAIYREYEERTNRWLPSARHKP